MRCYKCGNEVPEESVFCNKCGAKLAIEAEVVKEDVVDDSQDIEVETAEENIIDENVINENVTDNIEQESVEDDAEVNDQDYSFQNSGEYNEDENSEENEFMCCPYCENVLPANSKYCDRCMNYLGDVVEVKPKKTVRLFILLAIALIILGGLSAMLLSFSVPKLEGTWKLKSDDIFGDFFGGTYMVIDDDSIDYQNGMFTQEEWDYTYNPVTGTLRLSGDEYSFRGQTSVMHINWINDNMFVIEELNMTFERMEMSFGDGEFEFDGEGDYEVY